MNIQSLFNEPILEQTYLDPGYSSHANDVWKVKTASQEVVVRIFRLSDALDDVFWWGCHRLFGIDPRRIFDQEPLNNLLSQLSPIRVPRVLRKGVIDSLPYIIVEYIPGHALDDFRSQSEPMLEDLGQALARIHRRHFTYYGHPSGPPCYPLPSFHPRLLETIQTIVAHFYRDNDQIKAALEPICSVAMQLPPPAIASLIMIDLDPTQFLFDGERITAMVDTEAYVIGPRELDFIALEYVMNRREALAFAQGYSSIFPLPDLSAVRPVYRYLHRLLQVQGSPDLDTWMNQPVIFD